MMMGFLGGIYSGVKAARKKGIPHYHYKDLETTPWLYGSEHLTHLYKFANDDQKMMIHDYINDRFKVTHIESYAAINDFIEKDLKIGGFEPKQSIPKSHRRGSIDMKGGGWDDDEGNFPF